MDIQGPATLVAEIYVAVFDIDISTYYFVALASNVISCSSSELNVSGIDLEWLDKRFHCKIPSNNAPVDKKLCRKITISLYKNEV